MRRDISLNQLAAFLLCLLLFLPGISSLPLIDKDAALFAQSSKQMIETQDIWHIKFQDDYRHRKPPGFYWLQVLSHQLFSSFVPESVVYRIPSFMASLLCVLFLGLFTSWVLTPRHGLVSALALATSLLFVIETHFADTNTTSLLAIILMMGSLWCMQQQVTHRHLNTLLWIGVAFGFFIKGVAPVFAVGPLIYLLIKDRNLGWLQTSGWQWGIPLVIGSVLLWALPLSFLSGRNFLWDMVAIDFLPRLVQGLETHGNPPGYYFLTLHGLLWPVSFYFWPLIKRASEGLSAHRFLIIWVLVNLLIIELIPTKLFNYALPIIPALCILISTVVLDEPQLNSTMRLLHRGYYIVWLALSFLFCSITFVPSYMLSQQLDVLGLLFALIAGVVCVITLCLNGIKRFVAMCIAATLVTIYSFAVSLPGCDALWLSERMAKMVDGIHLSNDNPIYIIGYSQPSLIFKLGTHRVKYIQHQDINNYKGQWYIVSKPELKHLQFSYRIRDHVRGYQLYHFQEYQYYLLERQYN